MTQPCGMCGDDGWIMLSDAGPSEWGEDCFCEIDRPIECPECRDRRRYEAQQAKRAAKLRKPMKLTKLENETEYDWHMRQVDENLRQADRNMKQVVWMWKWLLIPMWSVIIILWIVRAMR